MVSFCGAPSDGAFLLICSSMGLLYNNICRFTCGRYELYDGREVVAFVIYVGGGMMFCDICGGVVGAFCNICGFGCNICGFTCGVCIMMGSFSSFWMYCFRQSVVFMCDILESFLFVGVIF